MIEEGTILRLDITKVASKEVPQPKLPTPIIQKAKTATSRYQIIIKPSASLVSNEVTTGLPTEVSLDQNYPNPFNPSTVIRFKLPENSKVQLQVFDVLGRQVAELVNRRVEAGFHQITFDARNLASGMYIYRLQVGNSVITKKLTLIK